jgi:hypothetical protein
MRKSVTFCMLLLFAAASSAAPPCDTPFPKPIANYKGASDGASGYFNISFGVSNFASYSNTFLTASPDLSACGLNTSASRTWLEVYTNTGVRIYGYCALSQNTQMQKLSFPWKKGTPLPKGFFIRLHDRRCNKIVQSNTVPIT